MSDPMKPPIDSTLRLLEFSAALPADLRRDPRYVDWGEHPDAVVCKECGEKGLVRVGVIVHGGIPFEWDPYGELLGGDRPREEWEGTLAVRIQHDKGVTG